MLEVPPVSSYARLDSVSEDGAVDMLLRKVVQDRLKDRLKHRLQFQ